MELEEGFIASPWKRINKFCPDGRLAYGMQLLRHVLLLSYIYLSMTANDCQEMGYIFKYPEIKYIDEETGAETWSIRQTGVYQRVGTPDSDRENLLILLHPRYSSPLQKALETTLVHGDSLPLTQSFGEDLSAIKKRNASPLELHLCILGTYIYNWRAYMKNEEELLINTVLLSEI